MARVHTRAGGVLAGYRVPSERERGSKRARPCVTCGAGAFRSCESVRVAHDEDGNAYTLSKLLKVYHPNR